MAINARLYGMSPFGRLAIAHFAGVAADASVTVSLAGSIFFTVPGAEARPRVLLFLALTMAPFAVVAPLVGPVLDRSRGGRRVMLGLSALGRGALVFLMISNLENLLLYPLAFGILVGGKTQSIAKSALVPTVVADESELVSANSRLALISACAGAFGGVPAAGLYKLVGAQWSLGLALVLYLVSAVLALRIPKADTVAPEESEQAEEELHVPSVMLAGTAMGIIRGCVGFLTFLLAFALKAAGEPAWFYGAVLVASMAGNFTGALVAPPLRKKVKEEWILVASMVGPAVVLLFAARSLGRAAVLVAAYAVAVGTQTGKLSFDSLVQRDAPDAVRGRSFARFETKFQLAWVAGALIPVALALGLRVGLFGLSLVLGFAGLSYLGGLRSGRDRRPRATPTLGARARGAALAKLRERRRRASRPSATPEPDAGERPAPGSTGDAAGPGAPRPESVGGDDRR